MEQRTQEKELAFVLGAESRADVEIFIQNVRDEVRSADHLGHSASHHRVAMDAWQGRAVGGSAQAWCRKINFSNHGEIKH